MIKLVNEDFQKEKGKKRQNTITVVNISGRKEHPKYVLPDFNVIINS